MKLADLWRAGTSRLLLVYGALFALWCAVLIGVIQWNTTRYLSNVVDLKLDNLARYFETLDRSRLPEAIAATQAFDLRDVLSHGLFDRDGKVLVGNLASVPAELPLDGSVHLLQNGVQRLSGHHPVRARAIALHLKSGELLVLVRDTSVVDAVGAIIQRSMLWGLPLIVLPGLVGALLLSRGPLRRVRAIETAVQPIMRGDLRRRLPVSGRNDEVDLLAGIVNTMLAEIERLMGEVKGVCDNIAHDLRTPLTSLRLRLESVVDDDRDAMIDDVARMARYVDGMLARSRGDTVREAPARFDLAALVRECAADPAFAARPPQVVEPLPAPVYVVGQREALRRVLFNLVENASAHAPHVWIGLCATDIVELTVEDDGPGIAVAQTERLLAPFVRGADENDTRGGAGLGLSIVAELVAAQGAALDLRERDGGGLAIVITLPHGADAP